MHNLDFLSYHASMNLTEIWIIVGKRARPARGNVRGHMVMVPSPHGPLYFQKPQWHDSLESAESYIKQKVKS